MKLSALAIAAVSLAALSASASFAQDTMSEMDKKKMMQNKPMVSQSMTTGKPMVMVPMTASAKDMYMTSWVYRNLDEREVMRHRAQGFTDATIKGAANIAMKTGVTLDYVLRQVREVGTPLPTIATRMGLSAKVINDDIPGYGLESMSLTADSKMMNNGMMMDDKMMMDKKMMDKKMK